MKRLLKEHSGRHYLKDDSGQALVVVLLLLVIAAIIAVAISFRTIQDIRRTGEEKASKDAATQVESMLDVVSSPVVFDEVIYNCGEYWAIGQVCELEMEDLNNLLGTDVECEDAGVKLRPDDGVQDFLIEKDDVFELNLEDVGAGSLCISWDQGTGNVADYVTLSSYLHQDECRVEYQMTMGGTVYHATNCVERVRGFTYSNPDSWGNSGLVQISGGSCGNFDFSEDVEVIRIRPVGGNARITLSNLPDDLPPQTASLHGYCYTTATDGGEVYQELVRKITVNPFLPSIFDYVLFSGDDAVIK
ncbi:hypothetical protein JW710_00315 [Candidatus Dojkabacteria bacterium]|nr:hypothetical protein [Candidatus Dojkabacteria bacterium]